MIKEVIRNSCFCFLWLIATFANSQEYKINDHIKGIAPHEVNFSQIEDDYFPILERIEAPSPGGEAAKGRLQKIKGKIDPKTYGNTEILSKRSKDMPPPPVALTGFKGNDIGGVPNDNDIAISQKGKIVSVINSNIAIYDTLGNLLASHSLEAFADTLDIQGHKYDPRVEYDPLEDRFVIAFLNGSLDSTSRIILAFSQTPDPLKEWSLYSLPGDALNNNSWSDFPKMVLTEDELFLTVNLLYNDSSWQKGFRQSIIWQIDKDKAFNSDTLDTRLYSDIKYNGEHIRNLTPIQGGTELKGPGVFLLSNKNFAQKTDTFFLLHITGKMDNSSTSLEVDMIRSDNPYGVPPDANQALDHKLATNDARILDGFQTNGRIHFVGNSVSFENNRASIYHGQVTNLSSNPEINLSILHHPYLEFGYPSIAFAGETITENKALIITNHTGDTTYPGYSGVYYGEGDYSGFQTLKKGNSFVNRQQGVTERWGDYSGLQRRYGMSNEYWAAGYYGYWDGTIGPRGNNTWITKLRPTWATGIRKPGENKSIEVKTYPNPVDENISVEFTLKEHEFLYFELYNSKGQKVKTLLESLAEKGKNLFTFSLAPLPGGIYFLNIKSDSERILNKKIFKK